MKRSPLTLQDVSAHRSVLYGFAALWILFHHTTLSFSGGGLSRALRWIQYNGACGVDMFVLLTGFGLYRSMNRDSRVGAFYLRRLERVALPAFVVSAVAFGLTAGSFGSYVCELLQFPYWLGVYTFWYVPFILTMYLVYPLIHRIQRSRPKLLWALFAAFLVFAWFANRYLLGNSLDRRNLGLLRIPLFLLGCILAPRFDRAERIPRWVLPGCLALYAAVTAVNGMLPAEDRFLRGVSYAFLAAALIVGLTYLARLCTCGRVRRLVYRCFAFCGGLSLEIYLLFAPIGTALSDAKSAIGNPSVLKLNLVAAVFTILLAVALRWFCELLVRQFSAVTVPEKGN